MTTSIHVGSIVYVTLAGLQLHSRSIPAHMGYSSHEFAWRKKLSKAHNEKLPGVVTSVRESGFDVRWKCFDSEIWVPRYMVSKEWSDTEAPRESR